MQKNRHYWPWFFALAILLAGFSGSASAQPVQPPVHSEIATAASTNYLGTWIWDSKTYNKQTCRLWRAFAIPPGSPVIQAKLLVTADNGYHLFLDGRELGQGSDWRSLTEFDLSLLLQSYSTHVLAVDAFNDEDDAGLILGLHIIFSDGTAMDIKSDSAWRVVPDGVSDWKTRTQAPSNWPRVKIVGKIGSRPWWDHPLKIASMPPLQRVELKFWQQAWFQILLLTICVVALGFCFYLAAQLTLQLNSQRLLQIERARIARDIHDDLGAGLTQLVLHGEVTQTGLPPGSPIRADVDSLCERARHLSHAMDEIVWAVNSRRDTVRDFVTYVCKFAEAFLKSSSIRCRFDLESDLPEQPFDLAIRRNLFLAVKEAVNNAAKHSGATELFLRIHRHERGLSVIVEDNGRGFDLAHASPDRNGLTNMAHRMEEVGGTCRFSGKAGSGCRVEFIVPSLKNNSGWKWRIRASRKSALTSSDGKLTSAYSSSSSPTLHAKA